MKTRVLLLAVLTIALLSVASQGQLTTSGGANMTVPSTDSTANAFTSDVVGSKADSAPATSTAANSTLSANAYLKALWNLTRSTTFSNLDTTVSSRAPALATTSEGAAAVAGVTCGNGSKSAWVQWQASTAAVSTALAINLLYDGVGASNRVFVDISKGGSGSEVAVISNLSDRNTTAVGNTDVAYVIPIALPALSRIAFRCQDAAASALNLTITVME